MSNSNTNSRWHVTVSGSLRWWSGGTEAHAQVKGAATFEALPSESVSAAPRFQIRYQGDRVMTNGHRSHFDSGCLLLPASAGEWGLQHSKLKSANAKGRAIILIFEPTTTTQLNRIQLTVPIRAGTDDGKLFVGAVEKAVDEWKEWQETQLQG